MLKTASRAIGLDSGRPISADRLGPPPTVGLDAFADQSRSRLASSGVSLWGTPASAS